jgi:FAD dependent oxidoreductase
MAVDTDVVIVGGGVQGILVLRMLRALGYDVLLLEGEKLGGVQTLHSEAYLFSGHLFAFLAGSGTTQGALVDRGLFREAVDAWRSILSDLALAPAGPTIFVADSADYEGATFRWDDAKLTYGLPLGGLPLSTASEVAVDTLEAFVPDMAVVMEKLATPHLASIRHATVTSVAPRTDGCSITAGFDHGEEHIEARAVVLACITDLVASLAPLGSELLAQKVGTVFARGSGLPEHALTIQRSLEMTIKGARFSKPHWLVGTPRVADDDPSVRAWLCSAMLDPSAEGWEHAMGSFVDELCGGGVDLGAYATTTWLNFTRPYGFHLREHERALVVRPVRLTLAPLAAEAAARTIDRWLGASPSGASTPWPGAAPRFARERWRESTEPLRGLTFTR